MILDREQFFQRAALETETVPVGDGEIIMTEIGSDEYLNLFKNPSCRQENGEVDQGKFIKLLILYSAIDGSGNRIFNDGDIDLLSKIKPRVYLDIANAARRVNGLSGDEKNSEPSRTESLPSDSA